MRYIILFLFILLFGCFQPNLTQSDITISDDIQGVVPNALNLAFFGHGTSKFIDEDDNEFFISTLFIIATDNEDLCDLINQEPEGFFNDLFSADLSGEFVTIKVQRENPILEPQEINNNFETNFIASNGIDFIVDAVNSEFAGKLNLLDVQENIQLSANFQVTLDLDKNNFINPNLNSVIIGRFLNASPCEGINDFFSINQ
jgi:hypothetical protein